MECKKAEENLWIHYIQNGRKSGVTAQQGKARIRWKKKNYKKLSRLWEKKSERDTAVRVWRKMLKNG